MVIITGWLSDHIGAKRVVLAGTLGVASCSNAFAFLASDFSTILILRTLTGMFAGAIYAPGMALLSKWFPSRERGFAIGVYSGALAGERICFSSFRMVYRWLFPASNTTWSLVWILGRS